MWLCSSSSYSAAQIFLNISQSAVKGMHTAGFFFCSVIPVYLHRRSEQKIANVVRALWEPVLVSRALSNTIFSNSCFRKMLCSHRFYIALAKPSHKWWGQLGTRTWVQRPRSTQLYTATHCSSVNIASTSVILYVSKKKPFKSCHTGVEAQHMPDVGAAGSVCLAVCSCCWGIQCCWLTHTRDLH